MNDGIADWQLPIADLIQSAARQNWQLAIGNWK
jgi:hypothetical protein